MFSFLVLCIRGTCSRRVFCIECTLFFGEGELERVGERGREREREGERGRGGWEGGREKCETGDRG